MIVYKLRCRKGHEFEGWFKSSTAFEEQAEQGKVACPSCNSKKIVRAPMAPAVRSTSEPSSGDVEQARVLRAALLKLRETVEANSDYVGPQFAEEARAMHIGERAKRAIHGEATKEEAEALHDEGVEFGVVPWIDRGDA